MNQLIKIIASLILINSPLYADSINQLYGAIQGGVFQSNFNMNYIDKTDVIPQNISTPIIQNGYTGGLAIGLTHLLTNFFAFGLEFSGYRDGNNALYQSGANSTAFSDRIKMNHHVDFVVIPELITSGAFFPYLKLGASYAWLKDNLVSPVGYNPIMTHYHTNKNPLGFVTALGLRHSLGKHIGLFSEINYHNYETLNLKPFENFSANYTHSTRLYSYGVLIGVNYTVNI